MPRFLSFADDRYTWLRPMLIWLASMLVLSSLAGSQRFQWSNNDHFAHLAKDLVAGRWTHPDPPPGYCSPEAKRQKRCRYHQFDDWARAQALVLDPGYADELGVGPTVWAMSCRTQTCMQSPETRKHRWWIPSVGLTSLPEDRYRRGPQSWFISFPPGPALWFLIPLWLGCPMLPDIPLTWILAATIPASLDFAIRKRWSNLSAASSLFLGIGTLFASAMVSIAIQGQVWFLAQISFAALVSAGLALWYHGGRSYRCLASISWGLALMCRPSTCIGLLAVGLVLSNRATKGNFPKKSSKRIWSAHLVLLGPLTSLGLMAGWNWYRFGDLFEFGHHFLEIRWMQRIQTHGMFSGSYLAKNLLSFIALPLRSIDPITLPIHGLGWLWSTPWILWLSIQRRIDWTLLGCVGLGIAPALFYQNTGQLQVSYRFALDLLPVWVLAVAPAASSKPRSFGVLAGCALLLNIILAWAWAHHPELIFGTRPSNWPFGS